MVKSDSIFTSECPYFNTEISKRLLSTQGTLIQQLFLRPSRKS